MAAAQSSMWWTQNSGSFCDLHKTLSLYIEGERLLSARTLHHTNALLKCMYSGLFAIAIFRPTNTLQLPCREQFAISQSTEEYEKLLSQIPGEFVGTSTRLRPLVKLLCLKMEQAFQDTGLTRPPWRQPESMLSKWLPSKVEFLG